MTDPAPASWPTDGPSTGAARAVTLTDLLRVPMHRLRLVARGRPGRSARRARLRAARAPAAVTASAVVAVRPVVTDAFTPSGAGADRAVNMNVESGIATGTEVVQRLASSVGGDPREIRNALEVEVPTGGQILRFTFQAQNAQRAVQSANLAAQAYLDVRRTMYEGQRAEMLRSYDASITKVAAQQTAVQKRASTAKGTAAGDAALAELSGINNQLTQLNASRTEIAAVDVNPGWVTQTAERALATSAGHRPLYLVAGLLGGALIGIVLAYGLGVDRPAGPFGRRRPGRHRPAAARHGAPAGVPRQPPGRRRGRPVRGDGRRRAGAPAGPGSAGHRPGRRHGAHRRARRGARRRWAGGLRRRRQWPHRAPARGRARRPWAVARRPVPAAGAQAPPGRRPGPAGAASRARPPGGPPRIRPAPARPPTRTPR